MIKSLAFLLVLSLGCTLNLSAQTDGDNEQSDTNVVEMSADQTVAEAANEGALETKDGDDAEEKELGFSQKLKQKFYNFP